MEPTLAAGAVRGRARRAANQLAPAGHRAAVLSGSLRSRELLRRVMRRLGFAPLIFTCVDEFLEAGAGSGSGRAWDLLLLGDQSEREQWAGWAEARQMLGIDARLPVLHAPMRRQAPRAHAGGDTRTMLTEARYYGELHEAVLRFLHRYGFEAKPKALRWDRYDFDPVALTVRFDGLQVSLDPVAFDLALELFSHPGRTLGPGWLRRMLPADERGANWHRIDNLACTVDDLRYALQLNAAEGWRLVGNEEDGFALRPPAAAVLAPA